MTPYTAYRTLHTARPIRVYTCAISALLAGHAALAQERSRDTVRAAPIIVTATRTPLSKGALPVAVTVITREQLETLGITTVTDALAEVSSAYLAQSGSQGALTSLFLRGGESKYVKVLIDGVPANDPGGTYDFGSLTTDNVERIEVVRGPASVLYGADAVTGVVQIFTRRGAGRSRAEVDVRAGMMPRDRVDAAAPEPGAARTSDLNARLEGELTSGAYSIAVARHQATGLYQLNNQYQNNVLSGRFTFTPVSGTDVRVALRYTDYQFNYPTNSAGTPDSLGGFDRNAHRAEDRTVIGVEVERAILSTLRTSLSLGSSVNDGGTDDALDRPGGNSFESQDKTRRRGAELRAQWVPAPAAALTFGGQIEQQDQRSQSQGAFGVFTFNSTFSASRRNTGVYGEAVLTPLPQFTATLGGRVDDNEQFGHFNTGRVGLSWRPIAQTRLRATGGTGFREPTFAENYSASAFVKGNPNLRPETARSADVGVDQDVLSGRASISLTAFAQRFRNMIDYTGSAAACGFSYCNVAVAESKGAEAEVQMHVAGPISASAAATLLRTRVLSPGFDTSSGGLYRRGESLIRRPEHKWTGELSYRGASPWSARARVLLVGQRTDRNFATFPATAVTLPAYHRIDVGAEYEFLASAPTRSSVTLRIENLESTQYQDVYNFLAPRRTISVGLRSRF